MRKNILLIWDEFCIKIFKKLKKLMTSNLILQYFNSRKKTYVKYDVSDYIIEGILSQKELNGELYLITYYLSSMSSVERNYVIYDKELLVIIRCFKEWGSELQSTEEDAIKMLIDYKALKYFILIKKLIR